jgi:uncharacterized protein (DUF488 family)
MTEPRATDATAPTQDQLYTIGHSTLPIDTFMRALEEHRVQVVVDVRSYPTSKRAPQFEASSLKKSLKQQKIKYIFMGRELGGRPKELGFYDDTGRVLYSRLAESAKFRAGIARLRSGIPRYRVAVMCSEEDPEICHRALLIGRVLEQKGVTLLHIRGNGHVDTRKTESLAHHQLPIEEVGESSWKSIRSVLRKDQLPTSSRP